MGGTRVGKRQMEGVFIVSGYRKAKNERHFAWLLIALLVCRNLILYVCDCFSLVFVWHLSYLFAVWWSHLQLQLW